jgi:hypothetical protein
MMRGCELRPKVIDPFRPFLMFIKLTAYVNSGNNIITFNWVNRKQHLKPLLMKHKERPRGAAPSWHSSSSQAWKSDWTGKNNDADKEKRPRGAAPSQKLHGTAAAPRRGETGKKWQHGQGMEAARRCTFTARRRGRAHPRATWTGWGGREVQRFNIYWWLWIPNYFTSWETLFYSSQLRNIVL